jgi:hypothetical protein
MTAAWTSEKAVRYFVFEVAARTARLAGNDFQIYGTALGKGSLADKGHAGPQCFGHYATQRTDLELQALDTPEPVTAPFFGKELHHVLR